MPAERERERDPEAVQRRGTRAEQPQHPGHLGQLAGRLSVFQRLERDVVAEPLGLLVGIGVTADVDQQRAVVGGRPRVIPGAGELTQARRDAALAQDVFHRLAEPQVDPQRQCGEQLRQPGTRIASVTHAEQPTRR